MSTNSTDRSVLADAIGIASTMTPMRPLPDGGFGVVVPAGYSFQKVPPVEPMLLRINQHPVMHDRDSFVAYVDKFKSTGSRIFAEPGFLSSHGKPNIAAALDYHAEAGKPDRCAHVATYSPRYSEQWQRWHKACSGQMKQAVFAEFIEEVRADIHQPEAAQLLDIVRAFKASKKTEFDSVTYQANGDVRLVYDEKTEQKGSSGVLPEKMKLGIPVYFRGTPYAVDVFVRYRVADGGVQFALKIDRADVIEDAAFQELTKDIAAKTGVDVHLGRMG